MSLDLTLLGNKLRRYREQFKLSLGELSAITGIAETSLTALEMGTKAPTGDELLILAESYKCDFKFFISNERLAPFEQTEILFRRFGNEFSKEDRWAVQEFLFLSECEGFLQEALDKLPTKKFVFHKRGRYFKKHAETAATELRSLFGYPDKVVPRDIFRDFREIGLHIFRRTLNNSNISGLCIRHPVVGACLLVNYSEDVYRQRFTVAHEAAHGILDTEEDVIVSLGNASKDLTEVRANTFASRYLMPPASLGLIPEPRKWDPEKASVWANEFRVSTEALAYALAQAGLIDESTVRIVKSARVGAEAKSDPEIPADLAPLAKSRKEALLRRGLSSYYVRLCFDAYREGIVSAARLQEMLLVETNSELVQLAKLYGESLQYAR